MDYTYIEELVKKAKANDEVAKKLLYSEFKPFIINLAKKTYIPQYDLNDIINECYISLFKCLKLYNPSTHRFVAYATFGIKNNLNYLIRKSLSSNHHNKNTDLSFNDNLDSYLITDNFDVCESLMHTDNIRLTSDAISKLTSTEKELIDFIFLKNNTIKKYAELKCISYSLAAKRKYDTLKKLRSFIPKEKVSF